MTGGGRSGRFVATWAIAGCTSCAGTRDDSPDAPAVDASAGSADAAPDAAVPDAGPACAIASNADWIGKALSREVGAGSSITLRADVRWTRLTTEGCLDRFAPTGTWTSLDAGEICYPDDCEPSSWPIVASDGELAVDRAAIPATFHLQLGSYVGTSTPFVIDGAVDGAVTSGGIAEVEHWDVDWDLRRADAVFTPPADGCSEPPALGWAADFEGPEDVLATTTWVSTVTEGCVDRFEPQGTATALLVPFGCASVTYDPSTHEIAPDDGELVIDRSIDPPHFLVAGGTSWIATRTCTHDDGTIETDTDWVGGRWASYAGVFDSARFAAAFATPDADHRWSFTRLLTPPATSSRRAR